MPKGREPEQGEVEETKQKQEQDTETRNRKDNKKTLHLCLSDRESFFIQMMHCRAERIRTSDPLVPNQVR